MPADLARLPDFAGAEENAAARWPDTAASFGRMLVRAASFFALLVAAYLQGRLLHALGLLEPGPDGAIFIHRWCRRFLKAVGVECTVEGPLPGASPAAGKPFQAVVANHLSYLDIVAMSAARPFVMVAKKEVRSWPLLGWLTAHAGTVYVERGAGPASYPAVNAAMARAFRSGLPVLFFPEGTTTDGSEVLPLRRGLFHSVLRDSVPVQAAALHYRILGKPDERVSVANEVCWWGDAAFVPHLLQLLRLPGIHCKLRFGPPVEGTDRFLLAENGHRILAELYRSLAQESRATETMQTAVDA